jgi:hypothetical protein
LNFDFPCVFFSFSFKFLPFSDFPFNIPPPPNNISWYALPSGRLDRRLSTILHPWAADSLYGRPWGPPPDPRSLSFTLTISRRFSKPKIYSPIFNLSFALIILWFALRIL